MTIPGKSTVGRLTVISHFFIFEGSTLFLDQHVSLRRWRRYVWSVANNDLRDNNDCLTTETSFRHPSLDVLFLQEAEIMGGGQHLSPVTSSSVLSFSQVQTSVLPLVYVLFLFKLKINKSNKGEETDWGQWFSTRHTPRGPDTSRYISQSQLKKQTKSTNMKSVRSSRIHYCKWVVKRNDRV